MSPFEKHFKTSLVNEVEVPTDMPAIAGELDPTAATPEGDAAAWQSSLEPNTVPTDFDSAINPELGVVSQNVEMVKGWVNRIEEFRHFINGLDGDSLNAQINKLDRAGSVFKGLVRSEENRIIRLAEDLAGLAEVFKAYMIGSEKKLRDMRER